MNYRRVRNELDRFIFLFSLMRKETKESRLSENFFKTTVLFFPRNRNSSFQKFEFAYCVFLAQVLQHKTEPCFVSKFPEGHSSIRLKKHILICNLFIMLILKSNFCINFLFSTLTCL